MKLTNSKNEYHVQKQQRISYFFQNANACQCSRNIKMRKGLIQKWRSTSGIHNKKDLKSSLLSQNQPVSDDHTSSLDDDDDQSSDSLGSLNALLVPQSRGWKILRRHLREGTLLLSANGEDETCRRRSRQSVRQEIVKEFHDGMHFSIRFCVSTIVAYLVLSIAMYSCVLEPNWTFIDSCYFAVSTFTTLGYGDLAVRCLSSYA